MIEVTDAEHLERLPDGTIIRWLRIPGDQTSEAVAFVRVEVEDGIETDWQTGLRTPDTRTVWISPGGWEPMTIAEAGLTYPVQIVMLPPIKGADGLPLGTPPPGGFVGDAWRWPQGDSELITGLESTCEHGGTWAREKALDAAVRLYGSDAPLASLNDLFSTAEAMERWLLDDRDPAITLTPAASEPDMTTQEAEDELYNDLADIGVLNVAAVSVALSRRGWKR